MARKFVLDTSVIVHDPTAMEQFQEHEVIVPYVVIYELDGLRNAPNGRGAAAREAIRRFECMRAEYPTLRGVPVGNGGVLSVDVTGQGISDISAVPKGLRDDLIIGCCREIIESGNTDVALVSKDIGLRLKASILGVHAEDYLATKVSAERPAYTGLHPEELTLPLPEGVSDPLKGTVPAPDFLLHNEFAYVKFEGYGSVGPLLFRRRGEKLVPVPTWPRKTIRGIKPLNDGQRMALDVLRDPDVTCVALVGPPGSGKTLLALAAGLEALGDGEVSSIMAIKPIVPVGGRDIGYLSGDKVAKLREWGKPFFDNLKVLDYLGKDHVDPDGMIAAGQFELEAITFMRGRTLFGTWVILDEQQDVTSHEIKTALSRIGEKTKCVLLADPSQIDNPYVDRESCGIVYAVDKLKNHPSFSVVPMMDSERSEFSRLVNERMA